MEEVRGSSPLGPTIEIMQKTPPNLAYGFSKVSDGNMSFVYGDGPIVAKARSDYLHKQGIANQDAVFIKLEHGTKIHKVGKEDKGNLVDPGRQDEIIGDGLITNQPGLTLFLVVADCIGAVIFDPISNSVGLIHAGRKGVEQNILKKAVDAMKTEYGAKPNDLILLTSPSISAESYVFDELKAIDMQFWGQDVSRGKDGKYHMDIKSRLESQAIGIGIKKANITISPTDTFTDINYFSHRRSMATGGPEGRFAVFAQIRPLSA